MIVRISRGSFEPSRYPDIEARLRDSSQSLIPAIQKLPGMIRYYVGIDRESSTSVGVKFERPIINYETLWTL